MKSSSGKKSAAKGVAKGKGEVLGEREMLRHGSRLAIFPGTFDPVTLGHVDILRKALRLFDRVVVGVAIGDHKRPLFSLEERVRMWEECLVPEEARRTAFVGFRGLLVDFAKDQNALAVVRGLRSLSDFEFEMQMAELNRKLHPEMETVFLPPSEKYGAVNSTLIKQIAAGGGSLRGLVPPGVARRLRSHFQEVRKDRRV